MSVRRMGNGRAGVEGMRRGAWIVLGIASVLLWLGQVGPGVAGSRSASLAVDTPAAPAPAGDDAAPEPDDIPPVLENGDRFEGTLYHGTGHGIYVFANGDRYEGEYRQGKPTGRGIFVFATGERYEGEFVNGQFEGRGTLTSPNGASQTGLWRNSEFVGQ
jgi:hypothetical protein